MSDFAELVAATNFSFLEGASHGEDMIAQAVALGHAGIGIADRNTVAGVVRAHRALRLIRARAIEGGFSDIDFKLVVGARLVFADGTPDIVAYPTTRHGWGRLTRLLTVGNLRAQKGDCILGFDDLLEHLDDLLLIVLATSTARPQTPRKDVIPPPPRAGDHPDLTLRLLADAAPGRVWLGTAMRRTGRDRRKMQQHAHLARRIGVPLLATNDALYAEAGDRPLHDVLTCIRLGTTINAAGRRLATNGERHLKPAPEMHRLFADAPDAVAQSIAILNRIDFALTDLAYEYPHEPVPDGWDAQGWLQHITYAAAHRRFPEGIPARLQALLDEELPLIAERQYAYYFLTVHDIVRFARERCNPPILCQGRGSAANSAVCWLLGVTSVDPMRYDLLFSRFVSAERDEPPDIDVDFEHERREEVMQYIYSRYGRHRAAIAATVIHYRPRSAVREVGKVLGLSEDVTQRLTSTVWGSFADRFDAKHLGESGFDADNPGIGQLRQLVGSLIKFPRHLSQHVGGYILTQGRLDETVPIHNGAMADRTFIEWDKDDIDELKIMKVDILALGMLTCIRKAFDLMREHGLGDHDLDSIPPDEPPVYDMLCKGDSIGVFQVESRAQINMLPRLRPRKLYDLVVQVAIVRPGPIEGDMVHPYLRRRAGKEVAEFPSPHPPHDPDELRNLLRETYGVPLFQEQAMKLAIVAAEFTPGEANQLRRAMATFRNVGGMEDFQAKLVGGMVRRGYQQDFAERCYKQIEGFGSYGFPESHALSFARLVYVSSWIKCFHPAVFGCAILNSQPMGFYAPAQLVQDARAHDVVVRPIDVNASHWDNRLEPLEDGGLAIRLGFRQIDGFRETWATDLVTTRADGVFASVEAVAARAGLPTRGLNLLADADAFGSIALARRDALWEVRRTPPRQLALFAAMDAPELGREEDARLPPMPASEQVAADYQTTRLSLKDHPMRFLRPVFAAEGIVSSAQAARLRDGRRARIAGVVLVRQRPGKGNAIFVTIEDETGVTNALMWARDFEANRRAVMAARLLVLEGVIQRSEEGVIHLMTVKAYDRSTELRRLSSDYHADTPLSPVDEVIRPKPIQSRDPRAGHPRNVRLLPPSRDFH